MSERRPAQVFHPGEFVADFLEEREQEPNVLHCRGWGDAEIEHLLMGELPVDPFLAMHLSRIWGTSAELWLNLQGAWDAWPESQTPPSEREEQRR